MGGGIGGGGDGSDPFAIACISIADASWEAVSKASAKVLSVVALVVVVDGIELAHVLPEKVLESDCRGRADFECLSKWKSPKAKPRVTSSSNLSSSSASESRYSRVNSISRFSNPAGSSTWVSERVVGDDSPFSSRLLAKNS